MPRVKNGVAHHARKKKVMEAAKGARGSRSKLYKSAKETVERGMRYAYIDRRRKKGEFRTLWIARINAAARANGLSYSRLMAGLWVRRASSALSLTPDTQRKGSAAPASPSARARRDPPWAGGRRAGRGTAWSCPHR